MFEVIYFLVLVLNTTSAVEEPKSPVYDTSMLITKNNIIVLFEK